MRTYEIQNLKCDGCVSTIERSLEKRFGGRAKVDLETATVVADVPDARDQEAKDLLLGLGYPVVGEEVSRMGGAVAKAKSFVSCAVGRIHT